MPPFSGTPQERRDWIVFLSSMGDISAGPVPAEQQSGTQDTVRTILDPAPGDWPTYSGNISGNRYSALTESMPETLTNCGSHGAIQFLISGWRPPPWLTDGVMYVTWPNQVSVLDGRTGREIWRYSRPRTPGGMIAADADRVQIAALQCWVTAYSL